MGKGVYRDIPEDLRGLIEPVVEETGFELVDVTLARGRPPWLLRVTIDTPKGDGSVPIDRCATVSREIGTQLDAAEAIRFSYRLEVSSPGLDRVLARAKDFAAACGCEVQLETREAKDGRRRFRGLLRDFDGSVAKLVVEGREISIPFEDVAKANAIYKFSRSDFARG